PANVRVLSSGKIVLGEPFNSDTGGETIGRASVKQAVSAKYLAPEQLKPDFGPVGPATDLYCLGFMAVEMLLGPGFHEHFPGVGPNDSEVEIAWMRWHSSPSETLPPVRELVSSVREDLAAVLDSMLKKRVQDRCPDAIMALDRLEVRGGKSGKRKTPPQP